MVLAVSKTGGGFPAQIPELAGSLGFTRILMDEDSDDGTSGGTATAEVDDAPVEESGGIEVEVREDPVESSVEEAGAGGGGAAPAVSEPDYFSVLRDRAGVDFSKKYKTQDELFRGIGHLAQRVSQKTHLERLGEEAAKNWQDYQAYLQSRGAQQGQQVQQVQQVQQEQVEEAGFWNPPAVKPTDKMWVEADPDRPGVSRLKEGTPHDVRQRLEQYAAYRDEWRYNMENNPQAVLGPLAERIRADAVREAEERIWGRMQQLEQEREMRSRVTSLAAQRRKQVFQLDASGEMVIDAETRSPVPTEYGLHYVTRVKHLEMNGVLNPELQDSLAHEYAETQVRLSQGPGLKPAPSVAPGTKSKPSIRSGADRSAAAKGSLREMLLADNPDVGDDVDDIDIG